MDNKFCEKCNFNMQMHAADGACPDIPPRCSSANERQVGGAHYQGATLQHWDIVVMHDLDYFQGQITKYVMRWKRKNGLQDLEKAGHFLEKYIEEVKAGKIK